MDILKSLSSLSSLIDDNENRKVIKTFSMKKDWRELWDKLEEAKKEEEKAEKKRQSLRRQFWAKVEADTGLFDDMKYNEKNDEIEVLEDKKD